MHDQQIFQPPLPDGSGHQLSWFLPHGASLALALSNAMEAARQPMLIIAPDSLTSSHLLDELAFFHGNSDNILHFPDWETLPYDHFHRIKTLFLSGFLPSTGCRRCSTAPSLRLFPPSCSACRQKIIYLRIRFY
jgi:hypothetical protein